MNPIPFHLAVPVADLDAARAFYVGLLGCATGREDSRWLDLDFFGHQVTLHVVDGHGAAAPTNPVDGDEVPVPHFGAILPPETWRALAGRLGQADVEFLVRPRTRFAGEPGEQSTMFVLDPSGNAIEFKSFADNSRIFATA